MESFHQQFTKNEWQICLKVLDALKDEPFQNPDNQVFSGLITKIHKNAKRQNRQESYSRMRSHDLEINAESVLMKKALAGISDFYDNGKNETRLTRLQIPKNCYCCNRSYRYAHSFYTRLCPNCAEENYGKRFLTADLSGRNVILTGGRVKVGFATALKLLRSGANVVLTTRFPALALENLMQETDYNDWKDRLWVHGLDLRNLKAIQEFIDFYTSNFETLDILINNAAQTIKYPDEYYLPVIKRENEMLVEFKNNRRLIPNATPAKEYTEDLTPEDIDNLKCRKCGNWLRPNTLWFDESYNEKNYYFDTAYNIADHTDILFVVGTSGSTTLPVGIVETVKIRARWIVLINPEKDTYFDYILKGCKTLHSIQENSSKALPELKTIIEEILKEV